MKSKKCISDQKLYDSLPHHTMIYLNVYEGGQEGPRCRTQKNEQKTTYYQLECQSPQMKKKIQRPRSKSKHLETPGKQVHLKLIMDSKTREVRLNTKPKK